MDETPKNDAQSAPEPIHAPAPEKVDITKSEVSAEKEKAYADAAPQPVLPEEETPKSEAAKPAATSGAKKK